MKRCLLLFLLLGLAGSCLQAQDLVLTQQGDSLNCKINKVAKDRIYFTFLQEGEARKTVLLRSQIQLFQYNYYTTGVLPGGDGTVDPTAYPKLRLGVSGGWSYRTAQSPNSLPNAFESYLDDLRTGYTISGEGGYYFSEQFGAGLKFSYFNTSNSIDITATQPGGGTVNGKLSDDINIIFIGPYFSSRIFNVNKLNAFVLNVGVGYLGYQNKARIIDPFTLKGKTAGLVFDIGYDMTISKKLAVGILLSMTSGTLSEYEFSDATTTETIKLSDAERDNISRVDVSVGFRFLQ